MTTTAKPSPKKLARRVEKLSSILEVAKALTSQRDLDRLLELIVSEAAKVVEADRCTIFLVDRERDELWSRVAQGEESEIRIPMGTGIAGAVARSGAAVNIPDAYLDPRFNREVDLSTGYRTRNILCVPMRATNGEVTGVLQALNKSGGQFIAEDEELLTALGGQAAEAVENALLHAEIQRLFEGFVSASVVAIESRDPSTAGHSGRVARLTVTLAQATERANRGSFSGLRFSAEEINEIRYASLLHDFGKVGVREPVLVKSQKLYPHEMEVLRSRFEMMRLCARAESCERQVQALLGADREAALRLVAQEREKQLQASRELDEIFAFIEACNRPTVLAQGGFERLGELAKVEFHDSQGQRRSLLAPEEIARLSIPKGSLSPEERLEIESHVTHTYRFLAQIPWSRNLRQVPAIAYAHHERLDGTGYPRAIPSPQIPVQSKMMAISDVYDALTASDRPYKKAVPHERALDILKQEAEAGQMDRELLQIFVEAEVPRRALKDEGKR